MLADPGFRTAVNEADQEQIKDGSKPDADFDTTPVEEAQEEKKA